MKNVNKYVLFALSYVLNALGNALTIKGSVGTIVWTSTCENIAFYFNVTIGVATTIISIVMYTVSKLIGKDFKVKDTVICILLSSLFGFLVDMFIYILGPTPSPNVLTNYIYCISGVLLIAMCVSVTIYVNIAFLAIDDFLKNLRHYVFNDNIVLATNSSMLLGFALAIIFGLLNGQILNMTILTILLSLFLGKIIHFFDVLFGFKN